MLRYHSPQPTPCHFFSSLHFNHAIEMFTDQSASLVRRDGLRCGVRAGGRCCGCIRRRILGCVLDANVCASCISLDPTKERVGRNESVWVTVVVVGNGTDLRGPSGRWCSRMNVRIRKERPWLLRCADACALCPHQAVITFEGHSNSSRNGLERGEHFTSGRQPKDLRSSSATTDLPSGVHAFIHPCI